MEQHEQSTPRLLTLREVIAIVGIRRSEIYRRIRGRRFPAPVILGPRCSRFFSIEIQKWMNDRLAERDR